ncbi:MAG: DUF952 domain-containing protein [Anaerolineaceae bacterium]|nr:DUF952 domain-containing protein [Anaerolineaceae bacterium]
MVEQERIFHITARRDWEAACQQSIYRADSLADQGFIHTSTREQVLRTADLFYHGQPGLVLLEIDPGQVNVEIRYEDLAGEGMLFPHIYGSLNVGAVVGWAGFEPQADGSFRFPQRFQAVI